MTDVERRWLDRKAHVRTRFDRALAELESRIQRSLIGIVWDPGEEASNQQVRDATMEAIMIFLAEYEDRFGAGLIYSYLCSDDPTAVEHVVMAATPVPPRKGLH